MNVGDDALLRYLAEESDEGERAGIAAELERSTALASRLAELRSELDSWTKHLRHAGPVPRARGGDLAGGPLPDDVVPGYSILAEIGRGGQGVVQRALQVDTGRVVALKLLRDGPLASESALRRFRREVELAATLDHPGIVQVFEAGETPQGRHYVAMEFANGRRLDRHVEIAEPSFRERIELALQVTEAIAYAHRRGVIHLDVKPSNVVVTEDGHAKVLDFGLARSIQEEDPTQTLSVAMAQGTPAYMAPEQARSDWRDWDSRTDVYGLGVLLFEVVTGSLPYELEGGALEVMQAIAEAEPARPSTRLSGRAAPRELRDLDAIVWACLAKDPEERYASVEELAGDLRALLEGSAVSARDRERGYRLRQSLRAVVVPLALLAGAVLALSAVVVFLLGVSRRETTLRETADEHFATAREFANSFIHDIAPSLRYLPGSAPTRQAIVDRGRRYLETLSDQADDNPVLLLELTSAWIALGEVQWDSEGVGLGDAQGALESFDRALATLERIVQSNNPLEVERLGVRAQLRRSAVLSTLQRQEESTASLRAAFQQAERLAQQHPSHTEILREYAYCLETMSVLDRSDGAPEKALERLELAAELTAGLLDANPQDAHLRRDRAVSLTKIANHLIAAQDLEGALDRYREYREEVLSLLDVSDLQWVARRDVAVGHDWVGRLLGDLDRHDEALPFLQEAAEAYDAIYEDDRSQFQHQMSAASSISRMGESHVALGNLDEAATAFANATRTVLDLRDEHPEIPRLHRMAGVMLYKEFELEQARARTDGMSVEERRAHLEAAIESLERCLAHFEQMADEGRLSAGDAAVPDQLRGELEALRLELGG